MRKIAVFFIFIIMSFAIVLSTSLAENPILTEYPAVRLDPATGKAYDFGGQTVYIYDYWTSDEDWHTVTENLTAEQQAEYNYRRWLEETYNVRIMNCMRGDWGTCAEEMISYTQNPEGLALFIIEPGKVGSLISNGTAGAWNYDLTGEKWNSAVTELTTVNGKTYGTFAGKADPRGVLYFNKRILEEAGIDWNDIYDAQMNGTWTWAMFEDMLATITRDLDQDGVNDIYGLIGSRDDMQICATFSNGGDFFAYNENGQLIPTMDSAETRAALTWATDTWSEYSAPTPDHSNWDWYKEAWKQGYTGFYMYQAYGGFNDNSEMCDMVDEWGCVAFPVPNEGDNYITVVDSNVTMIPNCYDEKTSRMLAMIYDLWTEPTPGYTDENAWIGNKYNYTDERAVDETYAILREPEHQVTNRVTLLGTQNEVLGGLLWSLGEEASVEDIIQESMPGWQNKCNSYNQNMNDLVNIIDLSTYTPFQLPQNLNIIDSEAFSGTNPELVIVPSSCTCIAANAFAQCPNLKYIVLPGELDNISESAFSETKAILLLPEDSNAEEWARIHNVKYSTDWRD